MKNIIVVKNIADREALAILLIRAGYSVKIGDRKVLVGTSKKTEYIVTYWEEE